MCTFQFHLKFISAFPKKKRVVYYCKMGHKCLLTNPYHPTAHEHLTISIFKENYVVKCGPGSSVGIVTDYGLDGLGSNPGGDEIFRLSRLALGPTQPPVKWVLVLSWG